MRDPNLPGGVTRTLTAALQMVLPGEVAPTHRHSLSAIRWIIEGSGCVTVQNGEKIPMEKNDFIITPFDCWHDHRHEGTEPMFWLDGLDGPLIRSLGVDYFEDHPDDLQAITKTENDSLLRYATAGVVPTVEIPDSKNSPMMIYKFGPVHNQLQKLKQENIACDYDGHILEYINPVTGGSVMPTFTANIQLLGPGFQGKTHRHVSSGVYYVVQGSGYSVINGERLDWQERDVFTVPNWSWHQHLNPGDSDVILFHYNDSSIFKNFGLYKQENQT
jgi:gentisate 1,2-dioxygenase